MASLEIEGLSYKRSSFSLGVDLELPDGDFGVLLGSSGCGKSTTLRIIAGLLEPLGGRIELGGRDITRLPPEKRKIGLVFQDFALFTHLSVRRNIEYGPRLAGMTSRKLKELSAGLASTFHIEPLLERMPATLSGGEQQRVALARSIAAGPELLLLDEPLSSLDAALRKELRTEMRNRVKDAGIGAIQVTHDVEEALAVADKLFLMEDGRIREAGAPEDLYSRPRTAFTARLLGSGVLLEAQSVREGTSGAGAVIADTALGAFICAAPGYPIPTRQEGKPLFVYIPRDAAMPSVGGTAAKRVNLVEGEVTASSFVGGKRLVTISRNGTNLEFAIDASYRPNLGEGLSLSVPMAKCAILAEE
jgi:ABC-type sugar transport system ATPase subunit